MANIHTMEQYLSLLRYFLIITIVKLQYNDQYDLHLLNTIIHDFILQYILKITSYIFPFILFSNILCHKPVRQTVSKAIMPSSWLIGMIKPIYKNKGDKFDPKNYRPITIVSCLARLLFHLHRLLFHF
jgi:hypothetical protein